MASIKEMWNAALEFASFGWPVVPLYGVNSDGRCMCKNKGCQSQGKHPALKGWQNEASTDRATIDTWFGDPSSWPKKPVNVGIVLGPRSGLISIDVDTSSGKNLLVHGIFDGRIPRTKCFRTGGGGEQFLFHYREDLPGGANNPRLDGIDLKLGHGQRGSMSVMPPSQSGKGIYTWIDSESDVAELPDEAAAAICELLGADLTGKPTQPRNVSHWERIERGVSEGERHNAMLSYSGKLLSLFGELTDISIRSAWAGLRETNQRNTPPLPEVELKKIFDDVLEMDRFRRLKEDSEWGFDPEALPSNGHSASVSINSSEAKAEAKINGIVIPRNQWSAEYWSLTEYDSDPPWYRLQRKDCESAIWLNCKDLKSYSKVHTAMMEIGIFLPIKHKNWGKFVGILWESRKVETAPAGLDERRAILDSISSIFRRAKRSQFGASCGCIKGVDEDFIYFCFSELLKEVSDVVAVTRPLLSQIMNRLGMVRIQKDGVRLHSVSKNSLPGLDMDSTSVQIDTLAATNSPKT
jgi:hypothetical protein